MRIFVLVTIPKTQTLRVLTSDDWGIVRIPPDLDPITAEPDDGNTTVIFMQPDYSS